MQGMRVTFEREESVCGTEYMNNVVVRKVVFLLEVSHWLVLKWIKVAYRNMKGLLKMEEMRVRDIRVR
jgi:hypothetical protein